MTDCFLRLRTREPVSKIAKENCKYSWITHKSEKLDQGKSETAI